MNKTNLKLITSLIVAVFFIASCDMDEMLTKQPPGSAAGDIITTPDGVEGILIGAYDRLTTKNNFGGVMGNDWTYGEAASDNAYKGTSFGDQLSFNSVERYEVLPSNGYMANRWSQSYRGVARANDVLVFLAAVQASDNPVSEPRATQIEAEAKFLRAWYHFKATRVFRNIPYIKTIEEMDGTLPEDVPNDTEGWEGIEADLQFAIDNLPETRPLGQPGRPSKFSAMALKAHAHLYQNEHSQAKPLLDAIIASGQFELADHFNDNLSAFGNNNKESIFEIQISVTGETTGSTRTSDRATAHQSGPVSVGWGFYQPSQLLFEAYQVTNDGLPVLDIEDRVPLANDMGIGSSEEFIPTDHPLDPRVDYTIARRGVDFHGFAIHAGRSWIREQDNGGPYMTKRYHYSAEEEAAGLFRSGGFSARNDRSYRLGLVLLWRAEIAVEENDLEYARELVNAIRERARDSEPVMGRVTTYVFDGRPVEVDWDQPAANYLIEPYPEGHEAFASQESARKAVRHELRLETAVEGHRFFDLRRWGIASEVLNDYIARDGEFRTFMRGASFNAPKDEYWPLPESQLDIQDALQQDPNY